MAACVGCGRDNPAGARFCAGCGASLTAACSHCSSELPPDARFCAFCGRSVAEAATSPGVPVEMIKLVTVLFADVVGSTAQAELMHPEDTRALMAEFFDAMSEEIRAEGGTIERIIGDAIMADFGVPIAREDDPVRAVRAARRMLERVEKLNAGRDEALHIQIRIGINTGAVSTGGSFGEQLLVMGDAVNVAARLQQAAPTGTVLIGERTARAVRRFFRLRQVTSVSAKGKTQPVQAFAVEEEVDGSESSSLQRAGRLIGRDAELQILRSFFDKVSKSSAPFICTVVGDPGVGKSRLSTEFIDLLGNEATVLIGRCPPYGEGATLAPLREILRGEAGIFPQDDPGVTFEKISRFVADVMGEVAADEARSIAAGLGSTIGSATALELFRDVDPRLVHRAMLSAWQRVLAQIAGPRPLVVLVEDIHWADQRMLDVLAELSQNMAAPVLFVCSARPELVTSKPEWLAMLQAHSTVHLDALPSGASADLVAELLGAKQIPREILPRVLDRAEGNPLFIEEILLRLIDEGYLKQDTGGWKIAEDVADIEVPERIQTLIQARLDRLTPREREVVQAGAVVGRQFWSGALEWVTGFPDAKEVLEALQPRYMIVEQAHSSVAGETEYSFRHSLIREVAYDNLPRKVRARAHAATAKWIESVRGPRAVESAELLAEHYERAYEGVGDEGSRISARRYRLVATETALRKFEVDQAERLGQRAVELSLPGHEKVEALEALGDAFYLALRGTPAWSAYAGAVAELEVVTTRDRATLARLAAKAAMVPTRWVGTMDDDVSSEAVEAVIERGLEAAGEQDSRERALLLSARAFLEGTADQAIESESSPGRVAAREAVAMAQRLEEPSLVSAAMDAMAVLLWPTGRFGEISRIDRQRLELVPSLWDVREIADILLSAGRDLGKLGEYREALGYLDQAADRVREIDTGQYLHVLVQRSQLRFMLGDWDAALEDLADIERLETGAKERIPPYAGRAYGVGFFCHCLRGDPVADRYLQLLRHYREDIADWAEASGPLAVPARALALRGRVEEALEWVSLDVSGFIRAEHLQSMCDTVAVAGDWDRAREILVAARAEAVTAEMAILGFFADRLGGSMAAALGNPDEAISCFARAAEGFRTLQAPWEEAFSRLLLGEQYAQAGTLNEAQRQLSLALPVFEELGCVVEAKRAQALLGPALTNEPVGVED